MEAEATEGKNRNLMREIRACRRSVRAHLQSIRSDWIVVEQVMSGKYHVFAFIFNRIMRNQCDCISHLCT